MIMSSRGNFPTASAYSSILTNGQSYSPPTTPIPAEAYAALHQVIITHTKEKFVRMFSLILKKLTLVGRILRKFKDNWITRFG
jgi:hypothetical protein